MSRVALVALVAAVLLAGCPDPPFTCGTFFVADPATMTCHCPAGYAEGEDGSCEPLDGGLRNDGAVTGPDGCALRTFYRDQDGDTFGDPATTEEDCIRPEGYVENADDCDDGCPTCRPGGTEVCDGRLDEDCAGGADDGCGCPTGTTRACLSATGCEAELGTAAYCASCTDACGWDCESTSCNDAVFVSAGGGHTCAIRESRDVVCWGEDMEIGDRVATDRLTPFPVPGLPADVVQIATSYHTCALLSTGAVWCWGLNEFGPLGDGTTDELDAVGPVSMLSSAVASIAAGANHTCAALTTGAVRCWGSNEGGQIGDPSLTDVRALTPRAVGGLSDVVSIAAGEFHTCTLSEDGSVRCWGDNRRGQLGDGTRTFRPSPVLVSVTGVSAITAGYYHTCALLSTGAVRCWGENTTGQVGDGTTTDRPNPVMPAGLDRDVAAIDAGGLHTCALLTSGAALCWGDNRSGQLGDGTSAIRTAPTTVSGLSRGVAQISGGDSHSCALLAAGSVRCWGANRDGQLGDGTLEARVEPVVVSAP
jgi:alpha-tubulin suppressor-like RCC1 family protein